MKIEIGKKYIFTQSGNVVKVIDKTSTVLDGKKVNCFCVLTDTGKELVCSGNKLIKTDETLR